MAYDTEFARAKEYRKAWSDIEVTDRPTGAFGVYDHTKNDTFANQQKGAAAAYAVEVTKCEKDKALGQPEYWLKLGALVEGSRAGRCFSCAAVAAYTLVKDAVFDKVIIEIVGSVQYDHHFVILSEKGVSTKIANKTSWDDDSVVVDIWQGNLSSKKSVFRWKSFQYNSPNNRIMATLDIKSRATHRSMAGNFLIGERQESELSVDQVRAVESTAEEVWMTRKGAPTKNSPKGAWEKIATLVKTFPMGCLDCVNGQKSPGIECVTCGGSGIRWLSTDEIKSVYGEKDLPVTTFDLQRIRKSSSWRCTSCGELDPSPEKFCGNCGKQLRE